jgi:RNA polymerase-binding transcription factor DksA
MGSKLDEQLISASKAVWAEKSAAGDFQGVLDAAIASYIAFRAIDAAEEDRTTALAAIYDSIGRLTRGNDPGYTCSFCGEHRPKEQLAAGPNVFICSQCVAGIAATFAARSSREHDGPQ